MEARIVLERALSATGSVIEGVGHEAFTRPTPCQEWDVRSLLNHLLSQMWVLEGRLAGTDPRYDAGPGSLPDMDLVGDDPSAAYQSVADAVIEASLEPGAHERAGLAFGAYAADIVIHGWDVAQATGQDVTVDDEVAQWCLDFVRQGLTDDNRATAFASQQEVPPDASVMDELVDSPAVFRRRPLRRFT